MSRTAKLCLLFAAVAGLTGAAAALFFLTSETGRAPSAATGPATPGRAAAPPAADELITVIEGDRGEPYEPDTPDALSKDMGRLKGLVCNEAGYPIPGARVAVKRNRGVSRHALLHRVKPICGVETSPEGMYQLGPLFAGPGYAVVAEHDEYQTAMVENIFVASLNPTRLPAIVLKKAAVLRGWVRDGNGQPIAAARVALFTSAFAPGEPAASPFESDGAPPAPDRIAATAEDGSYTLSGVKDEAFFVHASAPGFAAQTASSPPPASFVNELRIDFTLVPERSISGRVTGEQGEPIEGAAVLAYPADRPGPAPSRAATGPDGAFVVKGLSAGRQVLAVTHAQFSPAKKDGIEAGAAAVAIQLERRSGLSGRVVDPAGAPVQNFRVSLSRVPAPGERAGTGVHRTYANKLGHFVVDGLDPGCYVAQVEAARFAATESAEIAVTRGPYADAGVITLLIGGAVTGKVSAPDQQPVVRATVTLLPNTYRPSRFEPYFGFDSPVAARPVVTDNSGAFALKNVPPGTYQLEVRHEAYPPLRLRDLVVADRGRAEAGALVMPPGGTIQGQVYSLTGAAVPGARVAVFDEAGDFTQTVTADLDGRYCAQPVPAGIYTLIPDFPASAGAAGGDAGAGVFSLPPPASGREVEGIIVGNGDTLTVNLVLYREETR